MSVANVEEIYEFFYVKSILVINNFWKIATITLH